MIIVGAGYVAAEFAHVFSAYGTEVTVVGRGDALLRHEDAEISGPLHRAARRAGRPATAARPSAASDARRGEASRSTSTVPDGATTVTADVLLLATGRIPNGDRLDLDRTGVELDDDGTWWSTTISETTADRGVRARRRQLPPPAQARRQPRGPGGAAQPAARRRR